MLPSAGAGFERVTIERGVVDGEILGVAREETREDAVLLESNGVLVDVAVHETVHHRRVGVNVDEEVQLEILEAIRGRGEDRRSCVVRTASSLRFMM